MVFRVLIFLFRTNGKNGHLDEELFALLWSSFWKCHSENYLITAKSSLSTIRRHISNSVLKDTLKLRILRTWIRANSFIKTSVTSCNKNSQLHSIPSRLHIKEHRWHFTYFYTLPFLPSLVFKFSPVFIGILYKFRFNSVTL